MGLALVVSKIFNLIFFLLILQCFLTWIPNINWYKEPLNSLKGFSEFFFAPFRKLNLNYGMLDFSPIIAFIVLGLLRNALVYLLVALGL